MNIEVGQRLRSERDWLDAPPGTIIGPVGGQVNIRTVDGWSSYVTNTGWAPQSHCSMPYNHDGGTVTYVGTEPEPETVPQFKQRFATTALGGAVENSVDRGPVRTALRRLHIDEADRYTLRLGMHVHTRDDETVSAIPTGTLLVCGDSALTPEASGLWAKTHHGVAGLLGSVLGHETRRVLRVLSFPDGTEVHDWPDEEDGLTLSAYKVRCWKAGMVTKGETGWCAQVEEVMKRCGLHHTLTETDGPGAVTRQEARDLRVGTILSNGDDLFLRVDDHEPGRRFNATSRTIGLTRPAVRAAADRMNVEHVGAGSVPGPGEVSIVVRSADQMDQMPVGTVIGEYTSWWIKGDDGLWHTCRDAAGGNPRAYGDRADRYSLSDTFRYVTIPVTGTVA